MGTWAKFEEIAISQTAGSFAGLNVSYVLESTETSDLGVICMAFVFLPIAQVYYFSSLIWLSLDVNDIINVLF